VNHPAPDTAAIRVTLPPHLRQLAKTEREVTLHVPQPATLAGVLDALEAAYPMLRGTIRDQATRERRAFIRFFANEEDWSHEPHTTPLPASIASGSQPLRIIGAMAGG